MCFWMGVLCDIYWIIITGYFLYQLGKAKASTEYMDLWKYKWTVLKTHGKICSRISEFYRVCFKSNIKQNLKSFCFCVTVPKIQPASRPAPNRNQGVPSQRADAGKVEELSTQVRNNYRNGFIFCVMCIASLMYGSTCRGCIFGIWVLILKQPSHIIQ